MAAHLKTAQVNVGIGATATLIAAARIRRTQIVATASGGNVWFGGDATVTSMTGSPGAASSSFEGYEGPLYGILAPGASASVLVYVLEIF